MTTARQKAIDCAKDLLEKEQERIRWIVRTNCAKMRALGKENEVHKRELAVLQELIRSLEPAKGTK